MATAEYFPVAASLTGMKLPFSEAVRVGDVLYLSGALGIDGTGKLVEGGVAAETRQALANIRAILERHGSSWIAWSRRPRCSPTWPSGQP